MHPFRYGWWACAPAYAGFRRFSGARSRAAEGSPGNEGGRPGGYYSWGHGPAFGVRRPLRYLAFKLDLSEEQVRDLAEVLNRLKTARGQSQLDWERSVADAADAFALAAFDDTKAKDALSRRVRASETLNEEIVSALRKIHAILHEDQRREFAYLLRSGGVAI